MIQRIRSPYAPPADVDFGPQSVVPLRGHVPGGYPVGQSPQPRLRFLGLGQSHPQPRPVVPPDTPFHTCPRCKATLPHCDAYFVARKTPGHGAFYSYCRPCTLKYRRLREMR